MLRINNEMKIWRVKSVAEIACKQNFITRWIFYVNWEQALLKL